MGTVGCEGKGKCAADADCEYLEEHLCESGFCMESKCNIVTIMCDQPVCKDGSIPNAIPGTCCEFEPCRKQKKCKKDKQCPKPESACEFVSCREGECVTDMIMCDMPPPCENN